MRDVSGTLSERDKLLDTIAERLGAVWDLRAAAALRRHTPDGPLTTRARGRSGGSVSRRSQASREPAFVLGARCNSSRPPGRGHDQHPREEDDRWHTNASPLVLLRGSRWQLPTRGGSDRGRGEGHRDVGPAVRRAGTRYPTVREPSSGLRTVAGTHHERCLLREPLAPENVRRPPRNRERARNRV